MFALPAYAFDVNRMPHAVDAGRLSVRPALRTVSAGPALMAAASPKMAEQPAGSTVFTTTMNLAKNIVGSGVLALAAGVGGFSSSPVALVPAMAFLVLLCSLSGYSFSLIARVGDDVGADTYKDVWAKVMGKRSAFLPAFTVIFKTFAGALAYSIIIGESFASIGKLVGAPAMLTSPNKIICLVSLLIFLPLSLMRDLSSLAVGSILGTAGTVYTALFMALRAADGSYKAGGAYHGLIEPALQPKVAALAKGQPLLNMNVVVLVSMLATTFLAHYNAPKFFKELAPPEDGGSKMPKFNTACVGGFGLSALLCGAIMCAGFLTFGSASQGFILNNYATKDSLAFLARVGISTSIIFSYPLIFVGLREGILGLFGLDKYAERDDVHLASTVGLLAIVSGMSLVIKDLGFVVAFGGAVLGSALVYVFPSLMFLKNALDKKAPPTLASKAEFALNVVITLLGTALGCVGGTLSLKKAGII